MFDASSEYKRFRLPKIAISTAGSSYTLLVDGSGMSIPLATLLSAPALSSVTLAGTVASMTLYAGGTFKNGAVTGGSVVATASFSASAWALTVGSAALTITGTNCRPRPQHPSLLEGTIPGRTTASPR